MCRKYWFKGYHPKPQGGTNFSGGTNNVLQFQMSLLQEDEMVPPFLLMYATAVASMLMNSTTHAVWFYFCRSFQAEKGSLQFAREFIYVAFIFHTILSSTSNFYFHLDCSVPHHQPSKLASEKVVRSKGGSLMDAKASKNFFIHHCSSFAASSEI